MLNTGKLAGKTVFITGASRGIGERIGLKCAQDGANVVIAAKTAEPHPKLPGTIYTAAQKVEEAGGKSLACVVDIRSEEQVAQSIEETVKRFGGIDILVNNASAISLTGTQETSMKKFDLMHQINTRGTYLVTKCALPYLKSSKKNPQILNISPPLNMKPRWFKDHVAYTMAKYGMSMCVLGMAEEFKQFGIGVNALWPKTAIITAAMEMLGGGPDIASQCRTPDIMADAAYVILTRDPRTFTGNFVVDEEILREEGVKDFSSYAAIPGTTDFMPDFFLDAFDEFQAGKTDKTAQQTGSNVRAVFDKISSMLNEELVSKVGATYAFDIKGQESGKWFLDLKNGSGSCGAGDHSKVDVTFSMQDKVFHKMFAGQLKPTAAFMSGQMKLQGDLSKAMKLEKLMGKMQSRSFHTGIADYQQAFNTRAFSTTSKLSIDPYKSVSDVLDRIRGVASEAIVKQVGAIYLFDVSEKGKYFIDFKNGAGNVGEGDPGSKPDVTITMNEEVFLKIFNRELAPATAFMTGKVKVSGDLSKALTLEKVMKATREAAEANKQG